MRRKSKEILYRQKLKALGLPSFASPTSLALPSIKQMIKTASLIYGRGGVASRVIYKKASYPITRLIPEFLGQKEINYNGIDAEKISKKRRDVERILFDKINLRDHLILLQIMIELTGNVAVYFIPAFEKRVKCKNKNCGFDKKFKNFKNIKLDNNVRVMTKCPLCGERSLKMYDSVLQGIDHIGNASFTFLNVNGLRLKKNPLTGVIQVGYKVGPTLRKLIRSKDKFIIETTPQRFIESAVTGKVIVFKPDSIRFFGGIPIELLTVGATFTTSHLLYYPRLLTSISDIFSYLMSREGDQSAIADLISPGELLYPSQSVEDAGPINVDLQAVKQAISDVYAPTSEDSDTTGIGVSPIPLGKVSIGETSLTTSQVMQQSHRNKLEEMITSIGIAPELILSGLQFGSTSIALRNSENEMFNIRAEMIDYLNGYVIPKLVKFHGLPRIKLSFSDLRSIDDVQKIRLMMELADKGDISMNKIRASFGEYTTPSIKEMENDILTKQKILKLKRKSEIMAQAEAELEANVEMANMQAEIGGANPGEQPPVEQGGPGAQGGGVAPGDLQAAVEQIIPQLQQLPIDSQLSTLQQMSQEDPELFNAIIDNISQTNPEWFAQLQQAIGGQEQSQNSNQQEQPPVEQPTVEQSTTEIIPQTEGSQDVSQGMLDRLGKLALSLGVPAGVLQDVIRTVVQISRMPQQEQSMALNSIIQHDPNMGKIISTLVNKFSMDMQAERNLNTPLPTQREQVRTNPV